MQVFDELNENKNLSLTLGTFDGIHVGHAAVIKSATDFARANGLKSALITFKKNPRKSDGLVASRAEKLFLISSLGIDFVYEIDFSQEFASMPAEEYLKNILAKHFLPKAISSGSDHRFGCERSGDANLLRKASSVYGYEYFEIPPKIIDGEIVGSSPIKRKLSDGFIEEANKLLGRKFSVRGTVVCGNRLGGKIGFKTANIKYPDEIIKIPCGVYQAEIEVCGKMYSSVVNFGVRPSVKEENKNPIVEAHILDGFCSDICGEELVIRFIKKIRDEKRFDSLDLLAEQIRRDIDSI
jgi:riboflavin kinase/FMN adenylyltransferase